MAPLEIVCQQILLVPVRARTVLYENRANALTQST